MNVNMKTKYNLRVLRWIIYRGGYAPMHCVQTGGVLDVSSEGY